MATRDDLFRTLSFYLVAFAAFVVDQFSKFALVAAVALGHSHPLVDGLFHLTYVQNIGAAWSLLSGHVGLLSVIAGCVALGIMAFQYKQRPDDPLLVIGLGLLLGGALGNLFDRVTLGYVRDMFDVRWQGQNVFPIFNVADIAVFCGVCLLLVQQARQPGSLPNQTTA